MAFPANINVGNMTPAQGFAFTDGVIVAGVGDLNSDGFADLGVSHRGGLVTVLLGSPTSRGGGILEVGATEPGPGQRIAVAAGGDINGDGFADLAVGAPRAAVARLVLSGVVFGNASGFASFVSVSALNGSDGFRMSAGKPYDYAGRSIASAGDIDGDGFDDLIVGVPDKWEPSSPSNVPGRAFLVMGMPGPFDGDLFRVLTEKSPRIETLSGAVPGSEAGWSVAGAGDVNGDGIDDVIVGARYFRDDAVRGAAYVVFGRRGDGGRLFTDDLGELADGSRGFAILGKSALDQTGFSVAGAGDVNGDGFDDVIVGAPRTDGVGFNTGSAYVVFGRASGIPAALSVTSLNGSNGFRLRGQYGGSISGLSVSSAGDVNGDGFDDLIVGAPYVRGLTDNPGSAYVVFGKASGFAATMNLGTVDGSNGFAIRGAVPRAETGYSVAGAGDVNGDGFDDLVVEARGQSIRGQVYVVYGAATDGGVGKSLVDLTGKPLIGGSGADTLHALGPSVMRGGAGDDVLVVNPAALRRVDGGSGRDTLAFRAGTVDLSDPVAAHRVQSIEVLHLLGGAVVKVSQRAVLNGLGALTGGRHVLTVNGGGNETVLLTEGAWAKTSTFTDAAGKAFDRYTLGAATVDVQQAVRVPGATITGTPGNDVVSATVTVPGQALATNRDDVIDGLDGDDVLHGSGGNDRLSGGAGRDILSGDAGDDILQGGAGNDVYFVDTAADRVIEAAGEGRDTVFTSVSYSLAANQEIEGLTAATSAAVTLAGNTLDNVVQGNAGDDTLDGGAGDDTLDGGAGRDSLSGGAGNDRLNGMAGADIMAGGVGDDVYRVDDLADQVLEAPGQGHDTVHAATSWTMPEGQEIESLVAAGPAGVTLTGNAFDNVLGGDAGDDILDGGAGNDTMAGGLGNDVYRVDDAGDLVFEAAGEGHDAVHAEVDWVLTPGQRVEAVKASGLAAIAGIALTGNQYNDALVGGAGHDTLSGGAGNDRLNGRGGADAMTGGLGNDVFHVDAAGDLVYEAAGAGRDTVHVEADWSLTPDQAIETVKASGAAARAGAGLRLEGNGFDNAVVGGAGDDALLGAGGDDRLSGGRGNDTLGGGAGADRLTGGEGADTFRFDRPDGIDRIVDFEHGLDRLAFAAAGFGGGLVAGGVPLVVNAASAAAASAPAGAAGGYFIFDDAGGARGTLSWDATGGSGADAVAVAIVSGPASLLAGDIRIL